MATIPVPDLLDPQARGSVDEEVLFELLELAFLGSDPAGGIDRALEGVATERPDGWRPDLFAADLFVDRFVERCLELTLGGTSYAINRRFLTRVLLEPPVSEEGVSFRQRILTELDDDPELARRVEELYRELAHLLAMLKAVHTASKVDLTLLRLDILRQARAVVETMATGFGEARSGLRRLSETAAEIQATGEYRTLAALLDYEERLGSLAVRLTVGADGRLRRLTIDGVAENHANPFYRNPWQRLRDHIGLFVRGYRFSRQEIVQRLVVDVFASIRPWLVPILELNGQLELYLTALDFRRRMAALGLAVSMPRVAAGAALELDGLFNPLLLAQGVPVPCKLGLETPSASTLVTGPNSGGKTRLLQALGLAQLLGQSGLFVPAARACLPLVPGLFASLDHHLAADQAEGRLGTELLRIRTLFEAAPRGSMVLLDELCSGTNPSEAGEIFSMVLELLDELAPVAFITTHFLDFARQLEAEPPVAALEFLQVELAGDQLPTYQFVPGVAETSLAAATARRLGVTFEELAALVEHRDGRLGSES